MSCVRFAIVVLIGAFCGVRLLHAQTQIFPPDNRCVFTRPTPDSGPCGIWQPDWTVFPSPGRPILKQQTLVPAKAPLSWNMSAVTGFTPGDRRAAQVGHGNYSGSPGVQIEGSTIGFWQACNGLLPGPGCSAMLDTVYMFAWNWGANPPPMPFPWRSSISTTLSVEWDAQIPVSSPPDKGFEYFDSFLLLVDCAHLNCHSSTPPPGTTAENWEFYLSCVLYHNATGPYVGKITRLQSDGTRAMAFTPCGETSRYSTDETAMPHAGYQAEPWSGWKHIVWGTRGGNVSNIISDLIANSCIDCARDQYKGLSRNVADYGIILLVHGAEGNGLQTNGNMGALGGSWRNLKVVMR